MNRKLRELETITLAMFAAVPLYATYAVSPFSVFVFHVTMTLLGIRVALHGTDFEPLRATIQLAGALYLLFFPLDAMFLSRSLIRASGHLIFFIIVYQTVESSWRQNERQRFLTTFLLFITSVATATHISIVLYIAGFTFLCFRHLIHLSHLRTCQEIDVAPGNVAANRAALSYVVPTTLIAAMLFPILPRVRNPFVSGFAGDLGRTSSGISESIDFSEARTISPDPEVVARVWMARDAVPFFTPVRLRVRTYERFNGREWRGAPYLRLKWLESSEGRFNIARPQGFSRTLTVQQRSTQELRSFTSKLFLPVGTHTVTGFPALMGSSTAGVYMAPSDSRGSLTYKVVVSRQTLPLNNEVPIPIQYPISPEILAMARQIAGDSATVEQAAARIETYLSTRFQYLSDPAQLGRPITVEEFLLRERRGHCEYFAAGMVVLMTALDMPSRIVGGYYGGSYNPLTGYFVIRQRDAHAWVETWDGTRWRTFDPTPAAERPGESSRGLLRAYWHAVSDSVNYFWDRYILTYSLGDQLRLFQEGLWRGRNMVERAKGAIASAKGKLLNPVLLMVLLVAGAAVFLAPRLTRRRSLFDRLQARLAGLGIELDDSTTAYEILARIRGEHPELADGVAQVVEVYVMDRFSPAGVSAERRQAALRAISRLK